MEALKSLLNDFDIANLFPDLTKVVGWLELLVRLCVLVGPVVLLALGLMYFFFPPKEANHFVGYRFYWGMGSVEAWCFAQKIVGMIWGILGLVLTVVMLLVTNGYGRMEAMDVMTSALTCILWQIGLVAASCIGVNIVLILRYDRFGDRRKKQES